MKNRYRPLYGKDIAERVESDCFSNEEKEILKIVRGKLTLTVKDQFISHFGALQCLYDDEDQMIREICLDIEEHKHYLEEIKTLVEKSREISNPQNYDEVTVTTAKSEDNLTNKGAGETLSVNSMDSETATEGKNKSINRNLQTQTSQELEGAEIWDEGRVLLNKDKKKKRRLNLSNALNFESREIWEEDEEAASPAINPGDSNPYPNYNDIGLTTTGDENITTINTRNDSWNAMKSKNTAESKAEREGESKTTRSIRGEAYVKALNASLELPVIRKKFWNKFTHLFLYFDGC